MRSIRLFLVLAVVCCTSNAIHGQAQRPPAKPRTPPDPKTLHIVPQKMFAPYWTIEPGWHSEIQLRNNLISSELTVTPMLRLADGKEYALSPQTIAPSNVVMVDIADELQKKYNLAPQAGMYGSVLLRYDSAWQRNLYAAVMVHNVGQPIGFHIDAYGTDEENPGATHEGIWWLPRPGVKDTLVISNASEKPNRGQLFVYDAGGRGWHQDVPLAARQAVKFSVAELVSKAGLAGNFGGFKFAVAERSNSVDTFYFMYDETSGFSALMKMFDHDPTATVQEHTFAGNQVWTEYAPMLALRYPDPALALPEGTELEPQVLIRNTTGQVQVANVTLRWRNEGHKGDYALPPLQLNPYETRMIDVKDLQVQGKIPPEARWALVKLSSSTAKPDDIMAIASSYDRTGRYGAQTPFFDQLANHWAVGAFEVDDTHNSLITVTNGGTKPADAVITFHYNQGKNDYEITRTVAPGDQAWINVGELIRRQVPDAKGAKLPADVKTASYDVRQVNGAGYPSLLENKIIVDKTYGHLAYGCGGCCAYCKAFLDPNPYTDSVGNGTWNTVLAQDCCDQWQDDVTNLAYAWGSDNPPVATVGNAYTQLVGAGYANGSSSVQLQSGGHIKYCHISGYTPRAGNNGLSASITAADIEDNIRNISIVLSSPAGFSGPVNFTIHGSGSNQVSGTTASVPAGTYQITLPRPSIGTPDIYTSLTIDWVANGVHVPSPSFTLTRKWIVWGPPTRHSQYIYVYESTCPPANPHAAYIKNPNTCAWQTVTNLNANFVTQTVINGTGISAAQNYYKADDLTTCTGNRPNGWDKHYSIQISPNLTGQCGLNLIGGDSVAVNPGPNQPGSPYNCGDNMVLVNVSTDQNAYPIKHVLDQCANTVGGCADGHVDDFNGVQGCVGITDLPGTPFWTVDDQ